MMSYEHQGMSFLQKMRSTRVGLMKSASENCLTLPAEAIVRARWSNLSHCTKIASSAGGFAR